MQRYAGVVLAALLAAGLSSPATGQEPMTVKSLTPTFTEPVTGMEFVLVQGDCYEMGDTFGEGDRDEQRHDVCVDDFYIGKYEVTNEQFAKFVEATGHRTTAEEKGTGWGLGQNGSGTWEERSGLNWRHPIWPADGIKKKMNHPVVQVSWYDAVQFAKWLTAANGRTFRLPYEAEWEYAARSGGKMYRYSWGNISPAGNVADLSLKKIFRNLSIFDGYNDTYPYTAPVGSFPSNELGIYDMTGNAWEWCEDWFDSQYYEESPKRNPRGPASGKTKVDRGGSWNNMPRIARISNRDDADPTYRFFNVGFRLVLPVR
jgi:sulfatase modifying factor 1